LKVAFGKERYIRIVGHPVGALFAAVVFAAAAVVPLRHTAEAAGQMAAANDPAKIADRALDHAFNASIAAQGIQAALDAGDADLAQSFVALAADRNVPVDPNLTEAVKEKVAKRASFTSTAERFVHGFWTGEPVDLASLAGTAAGDLFVFGDIRDAAREGTRYLTGQKYDPWILGLAGVGLAITAGTYATVGAGAPERIGLSFIKAARRTGRLNPALAVRVARDVVKVDKAGGLAELAGNVGSIEAKASTQATLDSLAIAEGPQDVSRFSRLAAAEGPKTRAIIKLLGRGAIMLTMSAVDVAMWMLWAALVVFGFVSSCKASVERITQRRLDRRKLRHARNTVATVQTAL
jgi:hypothetical protein